MIAMLTNFGYYEYVGVMKGGHQFNHKNVKIVNLSKFISHQSVKEGAWVLFTNYRILFGNFNKEPKRGKKIEPWIRG